MDTSRMNSGVEGPTPVQNPPRQHHFVPVFYTKQWAFSGSRVLAFGAIGARILTDGAREIVRR
jgi:hypothetical protein